MVMRMNRLFYCTKYLVGPGLKVPALRNHLLLFFLNVHMAFVSPQECRLNRASDAGKFRVRLEKELSDHGNISWDKFSKEPHFTVTHYAGRVSYQIEGMMEKNKVL